MDCCVPSSSSISTAAKLFDLSAVLVRAASRALVALMGTDRLSGALSGLSEYLVRI
jgi:hypothetical protein